MITVADLKDQTTIPGPHPFLKCFECGCESSANKSDYFWAKDTLPFFHCDQPMQLVSKRVVYQEVER
jgi:hypothetical protein